jgi:hypothetical protein
MNERHYERKFYHDLLNLVSSVRGISEVIKDVDEKTRAEMLALLGSLSETMIETIHARRLYSNLIVHDLKCHPTSIDCERLLKRLTDIYTQHTLAENKTVQISPILKQIPAQKIVLNTDKDLLQGALGYGIRTALESIESGQSVILGVKTEAHNRIVFSITFPGSISEKVKELVFKEPAGEETGLTGHSAYIFFALITEALKGSASWTTQGGSITISADFEGTV